MQPVLAVGTAASLVAAASFAAAAYDFAVDTEAVAEAAVAGIHPEIDVSYLDQVADTGDAEPLAIRRQPGHVNCAETVPNA